MTDHFNYTFSSSKSGLVNIQGLCISCGKLVLLNNTDFSLNYNHKYGLVAPNGAGKTTLMKLVAERLLPCDPKSSIHMVSQEFQASQETVFDATINAHQELRLAKKNEKALLAQLQDESQDTAEISELLSIHYSSTQHLHKIEAETAVILYGLGFTEEMQQQPTDSFSGGWRMRISLARALLIQPDLLILDEPTNHLDLNAVLWLTDYLNKWQKTLVMVSHDKEFLEEICTDILLIEDKKIITNKGSYTQMQQAKKERQAVAEKIWNKNKNKKNINKKDKKKSCPKRPYQVSFDMLSISNKPKTRHIYLTGVSFAYSCKSPLFTDLNLSVGPGDRICIVGANGSGKSTLLKLLLGTLNPDKGARSVDPRIEIAAYHQHFDEVLPYEKTPLQYVQGIFKDLNDNIGRAYLSKYGIKGDTALLPIGDCSGGQKSRIMMAGMKDPDILIMDEPTNHLDIESIQGLAEAICNFKGGVVIVSHDANLIRSINCDIWICKDEKITYFGGNIDDYSSNLLAEIKITTDTIKAKFQNKNKDMEQEKKDTILPNISVNKLFEKRRKNKKKKSVPKRAVLCLESSYDICDPSQSVILDTPEAR